MFKLFFAGKDDPLILQNGPYRPFTASHIATMTFLFILVLIAVHNVKQKKEYRLRFLWTVRAYVFLVFLNVFRFVWDVYTGIFDIREDLPLQLCGIQMFAIPLALFNQKGSNTSASHCYLCVPENTRWIYKVGEYMCEFVYAYGTVGFVLALILPLPTLREYPVLHFRSIQSLLYHATLGFIALMLPYLNYQPNIENIKKAYFVLVVCAVFTGILNALIGSNYLYTAYLPIEFELLPWPTYLPFLFAFALFVGRLPYYVHALFQRNLFDDMVKMLRAGKFLF